MSKKADGEPLVLDGMPQQPNPGAPPAYSGSTQQQPFLGPAPTYPVYATQQGHVILGQPTHQGYVVQAPQQCPGQYSNVGGIATVVPQRPAHDYMVSAVLVTLFCFFPTGILAIIRASDARAAASYGDMQASERHAKGAKKMINISLIAGVISTLMVIGLIVVYMMLIHHITRSSFHH